MGSGIAANAAQSAAVKLAKTAKVPPIDEQTPLALVQSREPVPRLSFLKSLYSPEAVGIRVHLAVSGDASCAIASPPKAASVKKSTVVAICIPRD